RTLLLTLRFYVLRLLRLKRFTILPLFFLSHTPPPETYTLSLHDALPISGPRYPVPADRVHPGVFPSRTYRDRHFARAGHRPRHGDRKSTRLNSSHVSISYAVFCLKKKNSVP